MTKNATIAIYVYLFPIERMDQIAQKCFEHCMKPKWIDFLDDIGTTICRSQSYPELSR
jgi:hypothetical protein